MILHISHHQKPLGYIDLAPDTFSLQSFKDEQQHVDLETIVKQYYTHGIPDVLNGEYRSTEPLLPGSTHFFLELLLRLQLLGYEVQ